MPMGRLKMTYVALWPADDVQIIANNKSRIPMRKKLILAVMAMMVSLAVNAQFETGKKYLGASLSSLNLSYNGMEEGSFGIEAKGGYMFEDNWMATAQVGYSKKHEIPATFSAAVGARYYIVQNGLYIGASVSYQHAGNSYDDFLPGVQLGYAFFLSRTVTIEPEIYYNQSFKNHSDYSTIGLRIGFGVYL